MLFKERLRGRSEGGVCWLKEECACVCVEGVWEVRHWILCLYCVMMEGGWKKGRDREKNVKGWRERDGGVDCFSGKLMRSIWTMWLLQHAPWVTSTTPKGNWNYIVNPSFFSFFRQYGTMYVLYFAMRVSKKTKQQQPVVICTIVLLSLKIYSTNTHTHTHAAWSGRVACFPGHSLWSCCFIVFADPISLPLWCDFSLSCCWTLLQPWFTWKKNSVTSTATQQQEQQQYSIIMLSL